MSKLNDLDKEYYDRRKPPVDEGGSRKRCGNCGDPAADHPTTDADGNVCPGYE